MSRWECQACGNTVEAPREPEQCPCGSEDIEKIGEKDLLEEIKDMIGL